MAKLGAAPPDLRAAVEALRDHSQRQGTWGIEYGDDKFMADVLRLVDEHAARLAATRREADPGHALNPDHIETGNLLGETGPNLAAGDHFAYPMEESR